MGRDIQESLGLVSLVRCGMLVPFPVCFKERVGPFPRKMGMGFFLDVPNTNWNVPSCFGFHDHALASLVVSSLSS